MPHKTHKSEESKIYADKAQPKLKLTFFHPRYWLLWLIVGFWYVLILLPYPLLYKIGKGIGRLLLRLRPKIRIIDKRLKIAERNLELCFPNWTDSERKALIEANCESVGLAIIETGMAWFWPDWRINKWCKVTGIEHIKETLAKPQGIMFVGIHFLNLELGGRIIGLQTPGIGIYRPNDNPVWDYLQVRGRMRSNKFMINRKDVKQMIRSLEEAEIIWYGPDHDYGKRNSVFAPFFGVQHAATTLGTYILLKKTDSAVIAFTPKRLENGKGYEVIVSPPIQSFPTENELQTATKMNQLIEEQILLAPEQYMWLHRRFKTRPEGEADLYSK
ncbi:LpxL/LpxP family Kdo(2)-lipid IV(A) lauroyl/palmitoleoyl acyltransferase [Thorsellia anophelis]|uniref:Lipid A biosynthesis acyltransferase n=1 Tax=Thorsellia anophelis DSM 18579 TaxID=1123402 RepID=A0A1I0A8D4_9GAMM|nr:LpxL/LpxP family Kdo(2)-lipid IV(A) lauroyl/palmitoleoyl acyltransferase [Thorsellia anophelis]SES90251.1 KDO2-lipid IV(A) lauroyltransferase [Thorsellia anophelis DSM 18579]